MPLRNRQTSKPKREPGKEARTPSSETASNPGTVVPEERNLTPWTPSVYTALKILLSARLCAAVWSNISDCDEVYNYWEPLHFLLHGTGFQTWEYSPAYAIRSYFYLWIYAIPCYVYELFFQSNKILVFYYLRCLLALFCSLSEVYFYSGVCKHLGPNVGRLLLVFLTMSSGMFIASTAFLPSSFSMYLSTAALGAWFLQQYEIAVFATAVSTLIGWPFAAILGLPIAYDILFLQKRPMLFIKASLASLVLIVIPLVYTDSKHFGKLVMAPLNIVLYNVFTPHGADLYGTEPCSFYLLNGLLNFNIVYLAALVSIVLVFLLSALEEGQAPVFRGAPVYLCLLPMYLWMIIFYPLAHKEERFLFPIYPMICLAAAVAMDTAQKIYHNLFARSFIDYLDFTNWISLLFCGLFFLISLSRTTVLYRGYHAPIETYMELGKFTMYEDLHPLPPEYPVNVCVGKEWYRFPSSFFLPDNWSLHFLKSEFKGQLPKQYSTLPNATEIIPTDMNDMNLEERSRYIDIKKCDYIIDSDYPNHSSLEPRYSRDPNWEVIYIMPFLDSQRSPSLLRAFYFPYLTDFLCYYVNYNVLQNKSIKNRLARKRKKPVPNKKLT